MVFTYIMAAPHASKNIVLVISAAQNCSCEIRDTLLASQQPTFVAANQKTYRRLTLFLSRQWLWIFYREQFIYNAIFTLKMQNCSAGLNRRVNGGTQNHAHRVICLQRRQIIIICTSTV